MADAAAMRKKVVGLKQQAYPGGDMVKIKFKAMQPYKAQNERV